MSLDDSEHLRIISKFHCAKKLNNQCKKDHFDWLNPKNDSKPFWKSYKPYFSNKHYVGESKIAFSNHPSILKIKEKLQLDERFSFQHVSEATVRKVAIE